MSDCRGMHREFRELLHSAEGQSRRVVVVFLDVRGFSSFAGIAESTDTAEFLKTVYIKVLDEYFPDAEFFKPTGDGLLILLDYTRENLRDKVRSAVSRSLDIVEGFDRFCEDDEMVNFDVPTQLGVGLARGSATSLTADGKVLDYSGRPLNLASRLMDLARPSGIVFDKRFGHALLDDETRARFIEDTAFVKGIAESKPMELYRLDGYTEIPEYSKRPLDGFVRFSEPAERLSFGRLKQRRVFRHVLSKEPARTDNIELHLWYPAVLEGGEMAEGMTQLATLPADFKTIAGRLYAIVDYRRKIAELRSRGVQDEGECALVVEYSVLPDQDAES